MMKFTDPNLERDTPAQLRVAVIISPDATKQAPGTAWLAKKLHEDPRFVLVELIAATGSMAKLPWGVSALLAIEERTLARPLPSAPVSGLADVPVRPWTKAGTGPALDVIVDFADVYGAEKLAARSRHGVWRLTSTAVTGGVSAALRGAAEVRVELLQWTVTVGEWRTLARASYDCKFLAARSRAFVREKAPQLVEQALARLACGLPASADPLMPTCHEPPPRHADLPGYAAEVGRNILRRAINLLRQKAGGRPRRFCLRLAQGGPLDFDLSGQVEFDAPSGHYWADPFLYRHGDQTFVFFEDYVYATGKGHISVGLLDGDRLRVLGPALQTGLHLSYPFVFEHDGSVYMLPETGAAGRLEIWRATEFPLKWELHSTALEGTATADSTLWTDDDGRWWLFTNICRDTFCDFGSELHLYQIDGPDLAWLKPHPLNPVVVGARGTRGGGRILRHDGRLLRPAQDNSHGTYGHGLKIMEIETLTPTDYREREIRHLQGSDAPDLIGCHHMDALEGRVIFDVRKP